MIYFYLSINSFYHLSIYLSIYKYESLLYINLSIHLSIYSSIHLSIYSSIHLSIYLSIHLSIYSSIHPSIYQSIYLFIHLYIYPSISLSICGVWTYLIFGRRGIAPTRNFTHFLKSVLNLFVCIKLCFFLTIFLSLSDLFSWCI